MIATIFIVMLVIAALYLVIGFSISFMPSGPQGGVPATVAERLRFAVAWGRFIPDLIFKRG